MASPLTVFPLRLLVKFKLDLEAYDGEWATTHEENASHGHQILCSTGLGRTGSFNPGSNKNA